MKGFDFIVAVIGLFGIGEILLTVEEGLSFRGARAAHEPAGGAGETWKILPRYWRTFVRSAFIGFWMGFKPGGATPASFMSYAFAKRFSQHPERFGKGEIEGVVAPETAAHAAGGAALLPMITLGIPGSPDRGGDARRAHHLGPPARAHAVHGEARVRLGAHRQHVHGQRHRRADGAGLRAALRGHPAHPVRRS